MFTSKSVSEFEMLLDFFRVVVIRVWEITQLNSTFGGRRLRKVLIELSPFPQGIDFGNNSAVVFYPALCKIPKG